MPKLILRDLNNHVIQIVDVWDTAYADAGVLVKKEGDAWRFFTFRQVRDGEVTFNEVHALFI